MIWEMNLDRQLDVEFCSFLWVAFGVAFVADWLFDLICCGFDTPIDKL